jgi:hypothetical protein
MGIDCTQSGQAAGNDLDTGTLQSSTWYYIWVIYNPTSQTTAGLASLANGINTYPVNPVLPSGYTSKRVVGVALTDSNANFKVFSQIGNHFVYDTYQQVSTGTTSQSWSVQNCAPFIPPISTRGYFQLNLEGGSLVTGSLRKNGSTSTNGHFMGQNWANNASVSTVNDWVDTDGSQEVELSTTGALGTGWYLRVLGFELNI